MNLTKVLDKELKYALNRFKEVWDNKKQPSNPIQHNPLTGHRHQSIRQSLVQDD